MQIYLCVNVDLLLFNSQEREFLMKLLFIFMQFSGVYISPSLKKKKSDKANIEIQTALKQVFAPPPKKKANIED